MSGSRKIKANVVRALAENPLEGEQLLLDAMYGARREAPAPRRPRPVARNAERPRHYKIVSISLYLEDIERLEDIVKELKARGHTKANKSQVIRTALLQLDVDAVSNSR